MMRQCRAPAESWASYEVPIVSLSREIRDNRRCVCLHAVFVSCTAISHRTSPSWASMLATRRGEMRGTHLLCRVSSAGVKRASKKLRRHLYRSFLISYLSANHLLFLFFNCRCTLVPNTTMLHDSGPIRNVGWSNKCSSVAPADGHIISREAGMGLSSDDRLSRGIRHMIRRTDTMKSSIKGTSMPLLRRMTSSLSSISPSCSESNSTPSTSANNQDTTRFSNIEIGTSTHIRVAEEVETAKRSFHESLPSTLLAEICHQGRHAVAPFEWDECVLGSKIGEGEFSHVFEVKTFRLGGSSFEPELGIDESEQRLAMKRNEKCPKTKASRYALKLVKPGQIQTPEETMLYVEAAG